MSVRSVKSRDAGRLRSASANSEKKCSRSVKKRMLARLKRKPDQLLRLKCLQQLIVSCSPRWQKATDAFF